MNEHVILLGSLWISGFYVATMLILSFYLLYLQLSQPEFEGEPQPLSIREPTGTGLPMVSPVGFIELEANYGGSYYREIRYFGAYF
ncbi:MAG: hypothetical protein KF770_30715 [Anaerolineae bacterium]|nr:hypothetical protein [Anaerolineae bacterium]